MDSSNLYMLDLHELRGDLELLLWCRLSANQLTNLRGRNREVP